MNALLLSFLISFLSGVQWISSVAFPPLAATPRYVPTTSQTAAASYPNASFTAKTEPEQKKEQAPIPPATKVTPPPTERITAAPEILPEESAVPYHVSLVEQEIFLQTNAERVKNGLLPLSFDATLAAVAREHSSDMIAQDYFSHEDKSGCSSSCRVTNAGYAWTIVGENIYMMSGYELDAAASAKMIVNGWMNSPGHRANILRETYTRAGVGVSVKGKDIYTTSMYAKPR